MHFIFHTVGHGRQDFHSRIILVGGLNYCPGRISRIGMLKHLLIHHQVFLILFVPLPVPVGNTPLRLLVLRQLFKAFFLFLLGNIEKQLDYHTAVLRQLFFKRSDIGKSA